VTLTSGTKLGQYEIVSPLGAGGMGEVTRFDREAFDREAAIKVLPSHRSENPTFRARFDREAKTISDLQQANICVLYDVGRQDGIDILVMEYLDGETLAARLAQAAAYWQKLSASELRSPTNSTKAHCSGIVHRDLKPDRASFPQRPCLRTGVPSEAHLWTTEVGFP